MLDQQKIEKEFFRIKKMGFIPSNRSHNTGIGKTFEDHLGVTENNLKDNDFAGFEVKSHRQFSNSKITLFTQSPSSPKNANTFIRERFGVNDKIFPNIKIIHASFFGDKFRPSNGLFNFKLDVDYSQSRVYLLVKDIKNNDASIDVDIYWSFDALNEVFNTKLKSLFLVSALNKKVNGIEHFHYTKADVFLNPSFDTFIRMLNEGKIQFDIRIGIYRTGVYTGKSHDHGSGFRIKKTEILNLYKNHFTIE